MKAELYKKEQYDKLHGALQDEGYSDDQMHFEDDICYVLPIGFFSFRFVCGDPFLVHFLVFKEHRSFKNAMILYRTFKNAIVSRGFVTFIAIVRSELFFDKFIRWVARDRNLEPYLIHDDTKFYHVTCRR